MPWKDKSIGIPKPLQTGKKNWNERPLCKNAWKLPKSQKPPQKKKQKPKPKKILRNQNPKTPKTPKNPKNLKNAPKTPKNLKTPKPQKRSKSRWVRCLVSQLGTYHDHCDATPLGDLFNGHGEPTCRRCASGVGVMCCGSVVFWWCVWVYESVWWCFGVFLGVLVGFSHASWWTLGGFMGELMVVLWCLLQASLRGSYFDEKCRRLYLF